MVQLRGINGNIHLFHVLHLDLGLMNHRTEVLIFRIEQHNGQETQYAILVTRSDKQPFTLPQLLKIKLIQYPENSSVNLHLSISFTVGSYSF